MKKFIQNKKSKKIIFLILLALILLSIPAAIYRIEFNNLCLFCHTVKKDRSFTNETHPQTVKCYNCHQKENTPFLDRLIAPHKIYTNKKPTINKNCLQCHKLEQFEEVKNYKFNFMQIKITHKNHYENYSSNCLDCHINIEHTKLKPKSNRPTMKSCEQCHQANMNQCLMCHQLNTLPKPLSENIAEQECIKCHPGFSQEDIEFHDYSYSHKKHKEAGVSCERCHSNQYEHSILIITENDCLICHSLDKNSEKD